MSAVTWLDYGLAKRAYIEDVLRSDDLTLLLPDEIEALEEFFEVDL